MAENGPQIRAVMTHLMRNNQRFAIMGISQQGPELAQRIAEEVARAEGKPYGGIWVNWGYKLGDSTIIKGLARDIPGTIGQDMVLKRRLAEIPVMRGIRSARDVGLLIDFTPTASYSAWISFFTSPFNVPFAVAPTSVMISELYPFLNSGQMVGMLKGIAGAAQYERLIGVDGPGQIQRMPVFMAHVTIILLILVGNYLEIQNRRRREASA